MTKYKQPMYTTTTIIAIAIVKLLRQKGGTQTEKKGGRGKPMININEPIDLPKPSTSTQHRLPSFVRLVGSERMRHLSADPIAKIPL